MNKKITNWLLGGPIWLKYAVELQLLDKKPDVKQVLSDISIKNIVKKLKDTQGLTALKTGNLSYKGDIYWNLFFLADIGLTVKDIHIEKEAKEIYNLQSSDGTFITMKEMKPSFFCIPTILLTSLIKMDYYDEQKIQKFIQLIFKTQRLDGGWHCAKQRSVGQRLQDSESCPMDNQNILMLLSQFKEYRNNPKLNGAIDLLLTHWEKRDEKWRPYGFGIGTNFTKLKYPAVTYGILRVLDVLSFFPYARKNKSFKSMMDHVRQKSGDGMFYAESIVRYFSNFDFGQKNEPSRWITFLVNRIEKRIAGGNHGK
ncbi:MAG: hypothetical protein JXB88_15190 [Spirochaetales bacterium]|nr:hypothetical protein [Spirochaetales bacterium]